MHTNHDPQEMSSLLSPGKLPLPLLEGLLGKLIARDPRLLVGPRAGEDAAVIDFGDRYLVAKTDPITFATSEIGWYAVNVNANDVAVMGAQPRWFLATLLLPAGQATGSLAESIFSQTRDACDALDISLAGGHTEVTLGLDRPILCGTMLGETEPNGLVTKAGITVGDAILLVKSVPIEGTALIALEREEELLRRGYPRNLILRAQQFLKRPGISAVEPALLAARTGAVHAMHDPTEGGVITGLMEIARGAGVGIQVNLDAIPILPEGAALCREFGLDPLGILASGAILMVSSAGSVMELSRSLDDAGYPTQVIGYVKPREKGLLALRNGQPVEWPVFPVDEITRLFV
jgi:hydrogenase expression/formation protein HypE